MAEQFVLVRLDKITGVDLQLFDFDYDLTWMAFFLNAEEQVLGRYGGRDAKSAEGRLSLAGLRFALEAALATHRKDLKARREAVPPKPLLAEDYPAARKLGKRECIHCHQVYEFRRHEAQAAGTFRREDLWRYPLPENVGLILDNDQGNKVRAVTTDSLAAAAGLRADDVLQTVNGATVASFADVQYALHRAPGKGELPLTWQRAGAALSAQLKLTESWRKTNWTWRPSMLDILPSLPVSGEDLSAQEKKALGLPEKRLAFRQDQRVGTDAKRTGVQAGDVIIGIDDQALEMMMDDFLAHIRRNYLVGDRITLNILRAGKRVNLPLKL